MVHDARQDGTGEEVTPPMRARWTKERDKNFDKRRQTISTIAASPSCA